MKGDWSVCSPETVINFTAVGYFFARDLFAARHVPIGIIHSSWGGTPAEAWTSEAALQKLPDFAEPLAQLKKLAADPELARRETMAKQEPWYQKVDPGSKPGAAWSAAELATDDWKTMTLPTYWENAGYPDFDGIFWFRRTFELPENWDGGDVVLHLGAVDDNDTTWVNGEPVGATMGWSLPRVYRVPASVLKRGENVIAVRVLDTGGNGGLYGGDDAMRLLFNAERDNQFHFTRRPVAVQAKRFVENHRLAAGQFQPGFKRADGALQRHDRAAAAVCDARRHLVSGRVERRARAAVSDDCFPR